MKPDELHSRKRSKLNMSSRLSATMALLLLIGLYFPTTEVQRFSVLLTSAFALLFVLLLSLAIRKGGHVGIVPCLLFGSITPLLLVFTALSGLPTLTLGALVAYTAFSLLLIINLNDVGLPNWFGILWIAVNLINIGSGLAMVAGVPRVGDFFIAHYSTAYEELVANMLAAHKPILTFGTHSVASFFFFLFFWTNLQAYKLQRKRLLLVFAVLYLVLTMFLLSVSALVFSVAGCLLLIGHFWRRTRHRALWVSTIVAAVLAIAVFWRPSIDWAPVTDAVEATMTDRGNGLAGRFLPGGTMYEDVLYLENHPLVPVGASFRAGLMFGDDGPVEYLLRGSVILMLLVYVGFYRFLRRNLILKSHRYMFFGTVLSFELGITILMSVRALFLIPVFVVYLNNLIASEGSAGPASSS